MPGEAHDCFLYEWRVSFEGRWVAPDIDASMRDLGTFVIPSERGICTLARAEAYLARAVPYLESRARCARSRSSRRAE